ncbi:hypothetical protein DFH07DRAFT_765166 [Mycena maculata]|uniref:Uncharacterized protein n=1 Tax=Mycena maculata TaxID=230809 RepID=A0AAD7K8M0_9AGAR|nr:hypothetical protein DFH07DRAFT_765166 [Mycena maculata]
MSASEDSVKCSKCSYRGPQSTFPQRTNLQYVKTCYKCQEKAAHRCASKRAPNTGDNSTGAQRRAGADASARHRGPAIQPVKGQAILEWSTALDLLAENKDQAFELDAFIAMTSPSAVEAFQGLEEGPDIAKKIAALVWDATQYRFIYKKLKQSTSAETVATYTFFCAQNDKEVTKTRLVENEHKRRACMKMDRFPCEGYLHVTVDSTSRETV